MLNLPQDPMQLMQMFAGLQNLPPEQLQMKLDRAASMAAMSGQAPPDMSQMPQGQMPEGSAPPPLGFMGQGQGPELGYKGQGPSPTLAESLAPGGPMAQQLMQDARGTGGQPTPQDVMSMMQYLQAPEAPKPMTSYFNPPVVGGGSFKGINPYLLARAQGGGPKGLGSYL